VPQGIPGYDAEGKRFTPHYDPARARMYLARARKEMGPNFPSTLTLKYVAGSDTARKEVTELQYEWKQIGLNVKLQSLDFNTWLGYVAKPSPSLTYTGGKPWIENLWIDDYPDAQDFTTNLLAPSSVYNIGNYDNPQFEKLITEALTARGSERNALYVRASRIALNDVAWSMIGQQTTNWRWKQNIKGMAVWTSTFNPEPVNNDWTNVDVS
jgi:oligopeptide transport system substrate-binding protein